MAEWWNALDLFQKILYCIAFPSTLILVIQTVMVVFGFGDGGEGVNYSDTSGIDFDGGSIGDGVDISASDAAGIDAAGGADGIGDAGYDDISSADGVSHEGTSHADIGSMRIFTIQTVMAFLCVFGWTAVVMYNYGSTIFISALTGTLLGIIAMLCIAKLVQQSMRLVANGTFNPKNAIGVEGSVYIPIPSNKSGIGKINIVVQGSFMECDAITEGDTALATGDRIRVTDILGNAFVVEKI